MTTYADANWASNCADRNSTSGGLVLHGGHFLKSSSKMQSLIALSSVESELFGIVKATPEALYMRSMLQDLGMSFSNELCSDASAVLGIVGLCRMRHLDCNFIYVQKLNAEKVFTFSKVPGADNPAGPGTKPLPGGGVQKHVAAARGIFVVGRPPLCPKVL